MTQAEERIRGLELAQAEQHGRGEERWASQNNLNAHLLGTIRDHERRLQALEKRVMYFAGSAAALGALISGLASSMI